jgi:hypothetical protein
VKISNLLVGFVLAFVAVFGLLVLSAGLFIRFGQDKLPCLILLNKSEDRLVVLSREKAFELEVGETCRIKYPRSSERLSIKKGDRILHYDWKSPGDRFVLEGCISLEISKGLQMFLLGDRIHTSSDERPAQPVGFPLLPQD